MCCLTIYHRSLYLLLPLMTKFGIGIPDYIATYKGYSYYYINVMAHLPMLFDYVILWLCLLILEAMPSMTMLSLDLHIHFQFILCKHFFPPILTLFIFNHQLKNSIFKHRGKTFCFSFCSLSPIHQHMVHVECLPVVRFQSFLLPLVALCSPALCVHPSMFLFISFNSFAIICSKDDSFSLFLRFQWPICLFLHLTTLDSHGLNFKKLPLYTPLLFQLETGYSDHQSQRYLISNLSISSFYKLSFTEVASQSCTLVIDVFNLFKLPTPCLDDP